MDGTDQRIEDSDYFRCSRRGCDEQAIRRASEFRQWETVRRHYPCIRAHDMICERCWDWLVSRCL